MCIDLQGVPYLTNDRREHLSAGEHAPQRVRKRDEKKIHYFQRNETGPRQVTLSPLKPKLLTSALMSPRSIRIRNCRRVLLCFLECSPGSRFLGVLLLKRRIFAFSSREGLDDGRPDGEVSTGKAVVMEGGGGCNGGQAKCSTLILNLE